MAQAGRVFKFYDYAYAEDCIERAKRAWKWAEDNPSVPHPYVGGGTGLYNDGGWSDEKLWAATEYGSPLVMQYMEITVCLYLEPILILFRHGRCQ